MNGPTKKAGWVSAGDTVVVNGQTMEGVVLKVVKRASGLPTVVVRWTSGSTGRHTITTLRRVEKEVDGQ